MRALPKPPAPATYRRHRPETKLLYKVMAREWETFYAERQADASRSPLPGYVKAEMEAYFACGILDYGFVLLECETCRGEFPVALSCKKRGFCPSCGAKRMSEVTVHLTDNILPLAPYRQWVLTFPHALRFWMVASRRLTNIIHRITADVLLDYYEYSATERGIASPKAGGVTFIQRFGSALQLAPHFHTLCLDGVYSVAREKPTFHHLPGPTDDEVCGIISAIAEETIHALRKRGLLSEEAETVDPAWLDKAFTDSEQLTAAAAASARLRIAFGARAGRKVRRIGRGFGYEDEIPLARGKRCYQVNGFSLHANRYIGMKDRQGLEKLVSYCARGAFSHERLSLKDEDDPTGDLVYKLKTPWSDGTEAIVLSPTELIEKLVALIPPPRIHLSRAFGIFAPRSKWREKIIKRPGVKRGFVADSKGNIERLSWSKLLKRVFAIDLSRCPSCGAKTNPERLELVLKHEVVRTILFGLGLLGCAPARAPPRSGFGELGIDDIEYESE